MMIERARGCMIGQLAGDALGSLVEFESTESIRRKYPGGLRELADGGTFNTIAGQPTDDSEMALMLARTLVERKTYDAEATLEAYKYWFNSHPFDYGGTVAAALGGHKNHESQANGALMRISPLGIFGAGHPLETVAGWAMQDADLTHPHKVCRDANALFAMAIAFAVKTGPDPRSLYQAVSGWASELGVEPSLMETVLSAVSEPPADYVTKRGWVLIAFQNALWQLLHAPNLEEGVVDTVMRGGDTDTNAAICGALLGAVYGLKAIPAQWLDSILKCRPERGNPRVRHPRPECFWPADGLELAKALVS